MIRTILKEAFATLCIFSFGYMLLLGAYAVTPEHHTHNLVEHRR